MQSAESMLRELDKAGLTDAFMAEKIGMSQSSITRLRNGGQEPSFKAYKRISAFYLEQQAEIAKAKGRVE